MNSIESTLSFGFKKTKEKTVLSDSILRDSESFETKTEKNYLTVLSNQETKVNENQKEKLVIPLIKVNKWNLPEQLEDFDQEENNFKNKEKKSIEVKPSGDKITNKAVLEILNEATKLKENFSKKSNNLTIPILMRNKVPDGFETDEKLDYSIRPDTIATDYESVPVEDFGMAMLRGMGWKDGDSGVKVREVKVRPKGLGLAADKNVELQVRDDDDKSILKNDGERDEEKLLEMKKGSYCQLIGGKKDGQFSTILGIDEDNARVVIKLVLTGEVITISQFSIKLVTKNCFEKNSRYLNKAKVDEYMKIENSNKPIKQENSNTPIKQEKTVHTIQKDYRKRSASREKFLIRDEKLSKNELRNDGEKAVKDIFKSVNNKKKYEGSPEDLSVPWLMPNLRVRIIDDKYKKGKYLKEKVIIEDVTTPYTCICRTGEDRILEDLHQNQLETVLPKVLPSSIMIVKGSYKSQMGEIFNKNKQRSRVDVQLFSDRNKTVNLLFDEICEFTGNAMTDLYY